MCRLLVFLTALLLSLEQALAAAEIATNDTPAKRGYRLLTTKSYLPPDFDQQTFDEVWKTWEEPLRSKAEQSSPDERRQMAFQRYGFTPLASDPANPEQYVVDDQGNWSMNCLACHQGTVAGKAIPGLPNTLFALETLTEEMRSTKIAMGKPLTRMDLGSLVMPLGSTRGATNAVMFGVVLMNYRDAGLNVHTDRPRPAMTHHDHDAPAWWHLKRKQSLYCDGFTDKGTRPLMQFLLVKENGPEKFRRWEQDFSDIYAWIESLESPKYPWPVDQQLAAEGRQVFNRTCADCHGTYGKDSYYPERIVPIHEVGTDRVRLDALKPEHRSHYGQSWFTGFGKLATNSNPGGYLAPPLDGVWATAPYFHNGSVPTAWHVLHPDQRPRIWSRTDHGFDQEKLGLEASIFTELPRVARSSTKERRLYFDTKRPGKSAAGHPFADELTEPEKQAVLEYLKTL